MAAWAWNMQSKMDVGWRRSCSVQAIFGERHLQQPCVGLRASARFDDVPQLISFLTDSQTGFQPLKALPSMAMSRAK